jgi:hypothetical protein
MRTFACLALTAVVLACPSSAGARIPIRVGIGDQNVAMFDQSAFQSAKFERLRFLAPWNVMDARSSSSPPART